MLETIMKGRTTRPPRLFVYGTEGIGKSTFAAAAPKPIFIQTEDGLDQIECDKFPRVTQYSDVTAQLSALIHEQHDYQTVCIDTVDWLESLIFADVCREFNAKSIEKVDGGYGRGHSYALGRWRDILELLEHLRSYKNMAVILVGHAKVETYTDPESITTQRFSPKLYKNSESLIREWSDAVLFATREGSASRGDGERIFRAVGSANYVAKNRFNFPAVIPLSWETVIKCMKG